MHVPTTNVRDWSVTEYALVCECGASTIGVGLIQHLDTKRLWYRLHQKKCNTCRPIRFENLACYPVYHSLMDKDSCEVYLRG